MTDIRSSPKVLRFGEFEVDLQAGLLFKHGSKVRLREQLFVVLSSLLERAGEIVSREELQKRLWPGDVVVDFDLNLNTAVAQLREALGDSAERPRFIETLTKRGYRFIGTVEVPAPAAGPASSTRAKIVVLPFANLTGDPDQDYLGDALTEELTAGLAVLAPGQLGVIARTTAMHYKGSPKEVALIGGELGVDYVLEGSYRRGGDRLVMNVQLIQTADQTHLFAGKYDAEMADLFGLQTRVAEDVAAHIPELSGPRSGGRVRKKPTEDLEAYKLYLQGRTSMYEVTPQGLAKAKRCYEEAIARDPQFALAYDGIGEFYWWTGFFGYVPPKQASFSGMGAVLRAIEIDPSLGETRALLAQFRQKIDYNWPEVRREMDVAKGLDPSSVLVGMRHAISYLLPHARLEEAIREAERGLEFDPLFWLSRIWLSVFLWVARDYDRGLREVRFTEELGPDNFIAQFMVANILRDSGKPEEAIAPQRRAVELSGGLPQMLSWLGLTLARAGATDEARSLLQRIQAAAAQTYVSATSFVWVSLGLGAVDEAFVWMERAIDERDSMIIPIKTYPVLDPLRGDPRFRALLRKMNLEP